MTSRIFETAHLTSTHPGSIRPDAAAASRQAGGRSQRSAHTLIPAIFSGGVGSRLWPVSRELRPKPFIRLADGQSPLPKAFLPSAPLPSVTEILTVTGGELLAKTQDEFREVNAARAATPFILEPLGRNPAPAIVATGMADPTGSEAGR